MPASLTLPWVSEATSTFVRADDMRAAISLALAGGLNVLFSGPGGHGKSEFLEAVFSAIDGQEPYVKSLGQGTTTEELYGGIDLDALNRDTGATLQYLVTASFMPHPIVVFEELFDAPPRVLTALKDTITARMLRNGDQQYPMQTRIIAAATNHNPQEIAGLGAAVAALVERFPIQLEVSWDSYQPEAFVELFEVASRPAAPSTLTTWDHIVELQRRTSAVEVSKMTLQVLAKVLSDLRADKVTVSPRTAMMALQMVRAAAAINGRDRAQPDDVLAVTYLPGCQRLRAHIRDMVTELKLTFGAAEKAEAYFATLSELKSAYDNVSCSEELLEIFGRLQVAHAEARAILGDETLRDTIMQLRQEYDAFAELVREEMSTIELSEAQARSGEDIRSAEAELKKYRNLLGRTREISHLRVQLAALEELKGRVNAIRPTELSQHLLAALRSDLTNLMKGYEGKIRSQNNNGWRPSP